MKTTLDCLPCFLKQALNAARHCTSDSDVQKEILDKTLKLLPTFDFAISPPENAVNLYRLIAQTSKKADPYYQIKQKSNKFALNLLPVITKKIEESADPFLAACTFSIAGNIIDYGALHGLDMEQTIENALDKILAINDFAQFKKDLNQAGKILYLADNSGELVFDGILIKKLKQKIILAVKEKPIINDALLQDAIDCGLDKICQVITNGTDCPGTPLSSCSAEFKKHFQEADLIISKGQGNFETLSEARAPVYFLFMVKCPVVKDHIEILSGQPVDNGQLILMKSRYFNND